MSPVAEGGERGLDRLLRAARAVKVPSEVRAVFDAEPSDPLPGQLWRVRWGQVTELALIIEVEVGEVEAAPVSLDDRIIDEHTLALTVEQSSARASLAVWTGLARHLPMSVLDRQFGAVAMDVTSPHWVDDAVAAGAARGGQPIGPLDSVQEVRAGLDDAMHVLAEAKWAPSGTGDLPRLLESAAVSPQRLMDLLRVTPQRAVALRRGQVPASAEEAVALAPVLGVDAGGVMEANPAPPGALVLQMSRPHRRAQVGRLAARRSIDERTAWLTATFAIGAQAARQTGEDSEPAWGERIDRYFQVTLES